MKKDHIHKIETDLLAIQEKMINAVEHRSSSLKALHPKQQLSAQNLLHYLALRKEDIRSLQDVLHLYGLSSLASSESHIRSQLQAILERLGIVFDTESLEKCNYEYSRKLIKQRSKRLFGANTDKETPHIMVTFDSSFVDNYSLINSLLLNGMNVARINCAHDNEEVWSRLVHLVKRACQKTGTECKIYMDLAGPKIRTKLIMKGKKKGRVSVKEGQLIWFADDNEGFEKEDIVISPNEKGILKSVKKGDRVYIDDGVIRGVVEKIKEHKVGMRISRISSVKKQIKDGKGINFPDSELNISSLTDFDVQCIPFICANADLVGYSFVRRPEDLAVLQNTLREISTDPPDIIIKIETPEAVRNLPALLLRGMHQENYGVMIARGDLAVEIGFERMGEIQEEILWICEAAHTPVIWATQVLESLNKSGMATRSEITDATHAAMAECIMINKGNHTIEVIETLKDILKRTGGHHIKKRFTFRPLSIAVNFIEDLRYVDADKD
ncbi:MAG: pyruvate kinase [Saprospiraceae bacterium]|nr:pyruvate kinase [Saprospiraceae bacterium]